jgi:hypothetical protein
MNVMSNTKSDPNRSVPLGFLLFIPFTAIFSVVLFCLCVAAIVSLATTGAIYGWVVAGSIPLWAAILLWIVPCLI